MAMGPSKGRVVVQLTKNLVTTVFGGFVLDDVLIFNLTLNE